MRRASAVSACLLVLVTISTSAYRADEPSGSIVKLTDDNFDHLTADQSRNAAPWFVSVTAPWCTHCQDLEPTWRALAEKLKGEVHVGKIDSTSDPVLQQRFHVDAYPSLYFLKQGETRQFNDHRTLNKLLEFAEGNWRSVEPVKQWQSPVSPAGRMLGKLRMVPLYIRKYYRYLHHEKHYSVLTLLAIFLSLPILVGLLSICVLDSYFTRSARQQHHAMAHAHLQ